MRILHLWHLCSRDLLLLSPTNKPCHRSRYCIYLRRFVFVSVFVFISVIVFATVRFLDKVRQHLSVTCRRHFVNRNPTLPKYMYTGMLVAKKKEEQSFTETHCNHNYYFCKISCLTFCHFISNTIYHRPSVNFDFQIHWIAYDQI